MFTKDELDVMIDAVRAYPAAAALDTLLRMRQDIETANQQTDLSRISVAHVVSAPVVISQEVLQNVCEKHGVDKFAEKTGLSRGTIYRYLNQGIPTGMRDKTRKSICHALKILS